MVVLTAVERDKKRVAKMELKWERRLVVLGVVLMVEQRGELLDVLMVEQRVELLVVLMVDKKE